MLSNRCYTEVGSLMAGRKIDSPVRAFTEAPVKIDSPLLTCLDHPLMAAQAVLLLGGLSLRRSLFNKGEYFFSMVHNYLKLLDRNQNGSVHFWAENTDASWFDVEVALPFLNRFRFVSARHDSLFLLHEFSSGHAVWSCASILPAVSALSSLNWRWTAYDCLSGHQFPRH